MIRRTVEISREPTHLAVRDEQLLILRREGPASRLPSHPPNLAGRVPLEDLGVLIVDQSDTTYTHAVLSRMAEHGCALVVCGREHLPCGMYLPLSTNTQILSRLDSQLSASKPTKKRLWSSIVTAKIQAQAANLAHAPKVRDRLLGMARRVRSGDPENVEAQAARAYWPAMFGTTFRRRPGDPSAPPPNGLLDYGYAGLRAAVARAIVSAGLLPALGVKHHNHSNPFCLADDLVEPLRPMVDATARELAAADRVLLDQSTKADLLLLLTKTVRVRDLDGPLQVSLSRYVASVVKVLAGEAPEAEFPSWLVDNVDRMPCT